MSGVRMPMRCAPVLGEGALAARVDQRPGAEAARARRSRCWRRSTRAGRCRRSAGRRRRAPPGRRPRRPSARSKTCTRISVWPWPPRPAEPDDLAGMGDELARVAAAARAGAHHRRGARRGARRPRPRRGRAGATLPMARDQRGAVEGGGAVERHHPARRASPRSGRRSPSISPRRCEIRTTLPPSAAKRRTWASSWPASTLSSDEVGSSRMTSLAGASVTVKARAISTICRRAIERSPTSRAEVDAVAGKDRVEHRRASAPRRGAASRGRASAGCMIRPFSATVRFGQSDSSWKTQRTPAACAAADRVAAR